MKKPVSPPFTARDTGLIPGTGRSPHASGKLTLGTTTEPRFELFESQLLSPNAAATEACAPGAPAPQQEKPLQ